MSEKNGPKFSRSPARSAKKQRKKIREGLRKWRKKRSEETRRQRELAEWAERDQKLDIVVWDVFGAALTLDPGRRARLSASVRDLEKRIRTAPRDRDLHYYRGLALRSLERHEEAIAELSLAIRIKPAPACYYERSCCLAAIGRLTEAVADCTAGLAMAVRKAPLYFIRARWFFALRQYERVIADSTESINLGEGALRVPPLFVRAMAHRMLERFPEALADCSEALALEPSNIPSRTLRASCHSELGNWQECLADCDVILRTDYTEEILLRRAWCLEMLDRIEEAIAGYDEAIGLSPDKATSFSARGSCLLQLGRYDEAAEDMRRAVEHDPQDANLWLSLSSCLFVAGRLDESLTTGREAVRLYPQGRLHRQNVINVLRSLGRDLEADGEQDLLNGLN